MRRGPVTWSHLQMLGDELLLTAAGVDPTKLTTGLSPFRFAGRGKHPVFVRTNRPPQML
jgi:hypothetical protein